MEPGGRDAGRFAALAVSRHIAVWMIPLVVLAVNAFWWLPGIWLASTKGAERLRLCPSRRGLAPLAADRHRRKLPFRLSCWRSGCRACVLLARRSRVRGTALVGVLRRRVFLGLSGRRFRVRLISCSRAGTPMPAYTALAVAGGAGLDELLAATAGRPRTGADRLDRWDAWPGAS